MANGLKIISEENFLKADTETARGWTHRLLSAIYVQNEKAADIQKALATQMDEAMENFRHCPGRNYKPVIHKMLVVVGGMVGGFLAVLFALKAKIIEVVSQAQ